MSRRTLAREIAVTGVTLHAGVIARMVLRPASPDTGILFRRRGVSIPALWSHVSETRLGTVIAHDGESVAVIEHLMAALAGAEIDDCLVDLDGPEPAILDGDALSYLTLLDQAGYSDAPGRRSLLTLSREVFVSAGDASCRLLPAAEPSFAFEIDFAAPAIGRQNFVLAFSPAAFRREIAPARTFGFLKEAEQLRAAGLARGADLTNTLVIGDEGLINPELRRFSDEFVRHKILDAIGDLKLAGHRIQGRFEGVRSSHSLNNRLLRTLFSDPENYALIQA